MSGQRIIWIDVIKSLSVIWIVGFWHYQNYCEHPQLQNHLGFNITYCILGAFFFVAGYLVRVNDVCSFIRKKIVRLYPLLIIACTWLYVCDYLYQFKYFVSVKHLIFSMTGIAALTNECASTIWFIDVLIVYFCVAAICFQEKYTIRFQLLSTLFILIVFGFAYKISIIDWRVLIYYPSFIIGHFYWMIIERANIRWLWILELVVTILLIPCVIFFGGSHFEIAVLEIIGSFSIVSISKRMKPNKTMRVIAMVSYASFCAYLFHRPIYIITNHYIGYFDRSFLAPLIIGGVLTMSYWVQNKYDYIITHYIIAQDSFKI